MKKVAGLILGLIPVSVYAECVPVPDCASIGYTETSCDGGSIKCPFDTSKLKCIPCDSSFRFACTGENVTGGIGNVCNGKYVTCSCDEEAGYYFQNGECICDTSCSVGNIYYSDGSCSSCLEENKTAVGIVVKDKELIASKDIAKMLWSSKGGNLPNLTDHSATTLTNDFSGKNNTAEIASFHQDTDNTTNNAAIYCLNYTANNDVGEWYLPAAGEFYNYFSTNLNKISAAALRLGVTYNAVLYWTSTESNNYYAFALYPNGTTRYGDKYYQQSNVICFRNI